MTIRTPLYFDSVNKVHTPMPAGDTVDPSVVPVSTAVGNRVQNRSDGLYVGDYGTPNAPYVIYVNSATGNDTNAGTTTAAPLATLAKALSNASALFPSSQFTGHVLIALQAGQTFPMPANMSLYDGHLTLTFYGDPTYGNWNGSPIGTGANPSVMAALQRPIITPTATTVSGQNAMAGFVRFGGDLTLQGVHVDLPAKPTASAIANYGIDCDFVRNQNRSASGTVTLMGSIINMTDTAAYWGFMGTRARSSNTSLAQFASQFRVLNVPVNAAASPTNDQLLARQYFVKMFPDWAGNNQQTQPLQSSSTTSSAASGILNLTWADTPALVVTTGQSNLASFPMAFDVTYGFRNYVFNMSIDQQSRPLNIQSSRLI